jgi:WD40 repeat protein
MRRFLMIVALVVLAYGFAEAQEGDKNAVKPIPVVKLDRKDPVLYEKDVEPILVNKCLVCHSGPVKEAKLDLSTYEALMKGGKRGKNVIPGKSDESLLIKLAGKTQKPLMPPKNEEPLSPQELALIKLWIDQGAKAPTGVRERPKALVSVPPAMVQPVRAIAISPDKTKVVAGRGNSIHVYEAASGNHVRTLVDTNLQTPDKKPVQAAHLSIVESLAYSPDGKLIASGSYQEVVLWDAEAGTVKQKLTGFADRVVTLNFSPDGKLLATGGGAPTEDGEIKIFDVETGKVVVEIKSGHSDTVYGVCFSPDGTKLATCGADKFVKVFEMPSGKFIKSFEGHTHHVLDVGWKPDGKMLVSAGGESPSATSPGIGVIKYWDYEKGEQIQRPAAGIARQVTRLVFVGKTTQFVTCSGDQSVRMINADNGTNVRNFTGSADFLYAVAVSPDGALVASGGEEGVVRLYDGAKGPLLKSLLPPGVEGPKEAPKK